MYIEQFLKNWMRLSKEDKHQVMDMLANNLASAPTVQQLVNALVEVYGNYRPEHSQCARSEGLIER